MVVAWVPPRLSTGSAGLDVARTGVAALVQGGGLHRVHLGAPRQRAVQQTLHILFVAAASGGVQCTVPVGVAAHAHLDADGGVSRPGGSRVGGELRALDCALWSVAMRR